MTVRVMLSPPQTYASFERPWGEDLENASTLWDRGLFIDIQSRPLVLPGSWVKYPGNWGNVGYTAGAAIHKWI